jgi:DNA-binding CsgD family transcriptional regulator
MAEKSKVIICLEAHKLEFPAAYIVFNTIHSSSIASFLQHSLSYIIAGGLGHGPIIERILQVHRMDLSAPTDFGLSFRDVEYLNGYLSSKISIQIADDLGVTEATVKSAFSEIRKKLKLPTIKKCLILLGLGAFQGFLGW